MSWLIARFGPGAAKAVLWTALLVLVIALLAVGKCAYDQKAATELKISRNQGDAAIKSGRDAVDTVGNRQAEELRGSQNVQETRDEINNATDVPGVTDAGRAGLCRQAGRSC
jgi:hypothetical protein